MKEDNTDTDNINEIWRDIKGYKGLYKVSNLGRVKNKTGLIMKQRFNKQGYKRISLTKYENGKKSLKTFLIHRLVATAFIDNPNRYEIVNHLSEDKVNNHVDNLEWCTRKHNNNHGSRKDVCVGYGKPRAVINKTTGEVFDSMGKAGREFGITAGAIFNACSGLSGSSCGYEWEFVEEDYIEQEEVVELQECEVA